MDGGGRARSRQRQALGAALLAAARRVAAAGGGRVPLPLLGADSQVLDIGRSCCEQEGIAYRINLRKLLEDACRSAAGAPGVAVHQRATDFCPMVELSEEEPKTAAAAKPQSQSQPQPEPRAQRPPPARPQPPPRPQPRPAADPPRAASRGSQRSRSSRREPWRRPSLPRPRKVVPSPPPPRWQRASWDRGGSWASAGDDETPASSTGGGRSGGRWSWSWPSSVKCEGVDVTIVCERVPVLTLDRGSIFDINASWLLQNATGRHQKVESLYQDCDQESAQYRKIVSECMSWQLAETPEELWVVHAAGRPECLAVGTCGKRSVMMALVVAAALHPGGPKMPLTELEAMGVRRPYEELIRQVRALVDY